MCPETTSSSSAEATSARRADLPWTPAADSLEFRCVDQVLRPPRRPLVRDEVVEADDRDGHAEEVLRHGARLARCELDACGCREKLDARRRIAHPQDLSRCQQGLRRFFRRREAEVTKRGKHALGVGGGTLDPEVEVGRGPGISVQGDGVPAEHEGRSLMLRQRLQEPAQVVRRRQLVQNRPPGRVEGRATARGPICRARSRHRDPRRPSSRRGSSALAEPACRRLAAHRALLGSTFFRAADRRAAAATVRLDVGLGVHRSSGKTEFKRSQAVKPLAARGSGPCLSPSVSAVAWCESEGERREGERKEEGAERKLRGGPSRHGTRPWRS